MLRRTGSALGVALCLCAWPALAAGDVELTASADRTEVALDGTVTLQITASYATKGDVGEVEYPPLRDFDLVSRSQQEQMSFALVNGTPSFRRIIVHTLTLTPKRAGDATIEPAKLSFHGRTYASQPIRIRVLPAGQAPSASRAVPPPDDEPDAFDPFGDVHPASKDLLLRASVDHDRPYVGQQVTYSLYLLARINVSSIDKLQLPRLDGFWSEEIEAPQQLVDQPRIIDGVPYHSYLLRRRALFPLRAGKAVLDPAEVEVLTGFGMLFSRGTAKRQSQPIKLDVQPLPDGKPPGFDPGNVGQWSLSASADPVNVAVGQPVTFRLVASGRGNVRDLRLPKLAPIAGVRAYDATTSDAQKIERGQITGTRTVEQLLVPERTGLVELPALTMDIFDPAQRAYRSLHTDPIRIQVTPAAVGSARENEPVTQNLLGAAGMRPIRLRLSTVSRAAPPWTQGWFWPLLALGPFGVALVVASARAQKLWTGDPRERRVRHARIAARKRLQGARALLAQGEATAFYAEVARAVTGYLADKQSVFVSGLTREELFDALAQRGHARETVQKLVRLLDDCDRARFAPGAGEQVAREAMLTRADELIAELDGGRA